MQQQWNRGQMAFDTNEAFEAAVDAAVDNLSSKITSTQVGWWQLVRSSHAAASSTSA